MRVLLIDDDPIILNAMKQLLTRRGHEVILAEDGEIGVQKALEEDPERIICDYDMPGLMGDKVYEKLPPHLRERFFLWTGYPPAKFAAPERVIDKFDNLERVFRQADIKSG